jgi:hypothetical protein
MEVDDAQEIDANTAAARAGYRFRVHYMWWKSGCVMN